MCVLLCLCSSSLRVNLFSQNIQLQTKGRSPECQRRCARRCDVFPYTFPQPAMWQMCCFFFPMLDPLRNTSNDSYSPNMFNFPYGVENTITLHMECLKCGDFKRNNQAGLLTSHLTLYSWGKYMPLYAAFCPPGPTDHPHQPA